MTVRSDVRIDARKLSYCFGMAEGKAGGSADERAQALRRRAASLQEEAANWARGAEGERRTSELLRRSLPAGYVVLEDLGIPGSNANVDHVVVGPSGVTVIDSKYFKAALRLHDGTLFCGRYPQRRELKTLCRETDKVRTAIDATGQVMLVRSVMCVHGPQVPFDSDGTLAPVALCAPDRLVNLITGAPSVLTPDEIAATAAAIERALPARAQPPVSATRELQSTPSKSRRRTQPPRRARSAPAGRPAGSGLLRLAAAAVIVVVCVVFAIVVTKGAVKAGLDIANKPRPPGQPTVAWGCPSPGNGWAATISWPPSVNASAGYEAEWSDSPTGTFRPVAVFGPGGLVEKVPPGSSTRVRVRAVSVHGSTKYQSADVTATAAAPTDPC